MLPDNWRLQPLGTVVKMLSGGTPSRGVQIYWHGDIPWYTAKDLKTLRLGDSQDMVTPLGAANGTCMVPAGTVLVLVRGMTLLNDVPIGLTQGKATFNQDVKGLKPVDGLDAEFLAYALTSRKQELLSYVDQAGHGTGRLATSLLSGLTIATPPLLEQRLIVAVLREWDRAIEQTTQLIEAKRRLKRGLMQQLLSGARRFPEFVKTDGVRHTTHFAMPADWDYVTIASIAHEVSIRNVRGNGLPVLSCSKYDGLVESLKYFAKQVFSEDTSNYKVVRRGQFAYPANHIEEGSIGLLDFLEEGIVSPIYTVFEVGPQVHAPYLYKVLKTETYRHIFQASTSASVDRRGSLRWNEFSKIRVPLPSLPEQRKVSDCIDVADSEIRMLADQLAALRQQKKGLMQRLLTGRKRLCSEGGEDDG